MLGDFTDPNLGGRLLGKYGPFSAAVCFEVIEHVTREGSRILLENLRRILDDEGYLLISTPNRPVYDTIAYTEGHINEMTVEEFVDLLEESGLSVVRLYGLYRYSPTLLRTLWRFGLIARSGDQPVHVDPLKRVLRILLLASMCPRRFLANVLKKLSTRTYLSVALPLAMPNDDPNNSAFVLAVARKQGE